MADYYSLLAKALANLPNKSMPSARRAIYDRARKALLGQLRTLEPALAEADVKREEAALDSAIQRLEGQFAPGGEAAAAGPSNAPPSPAGAPPAPRPVPPPRPPAPAAPGASQAPRPPMPPPQRRPVPGVSMAAGGPEPASAPPIGAPAQNHSGDGIYAPPVAAPPADETLLAPPIQAGNGAARPNAPGQGEARRRNLWPFVVMAVLVGIAGAVAFVAIQLRQRPQDLAIKEPEAATDKAVAAGAGKVVQRVPTADTPSPVATTPGATPAPSPSPTSSTDAPTPSPTPAPAASDATPVPAATPTTADASAAQASAPLAVAARAAMLVAVASDPQKPAISLGTVVWALTPAGSAAGSVPGVRAEIDVPDLKLHAVMTIQKNTVASLPASHTIDLRVTFADGAEIKGVKDMGMPQLRRDDPPAAEAVTGAKVKINDNYFLVGLTKTDADSAHNIDLLGSRNWFDFPLLLNDDRLAKLTFEKSADGERVVSQALAAWK